MYQLLNIESVSKIITNPTWDLLVVVFFFVAGFFYGISLGKMRLVSFIFSVYISGLILENLTYLDSFIKNRAISEIFIFRAVIFGIIIIILTILFNRLLKDGGLLKDWWQIFILSIFETGLLMSFIFKFLPAKEAFAFSPLIENIFASGNAFFWWLTLPLISLFFLIRKK